jgi:ribosome-associated translation inhibitor RaiA
MPVPVEISFRHLAASEAMEQRIRALAARLEHFSPHLLGCQVIVEEPHQHHEQGNLFDVRIALVLPGHEINVQHTRAADHAHEDPYVALRDAFRAARRQLLDYEREHRHSVHTP